MISERAGVLLDAFQSIDRAVSGEGHVEPSVVSYIQRLQQALSQPEPLTLQIAKQLHGLRGKEAYLFTGFVVPGLYPEGENDGPLGTLVLARALHLAGLIPMIWVDPQLLDNIMWLAAELAVSVPIKAIDLAQLAECRNEPAVVIAIEKPGANDNGIMHTFAGLPVSSGSISIDALFLEWNAMGTLTMAIGDRGNEIGFGALREQVVQWAPGSTDCHCGCTGGVAATTPAQFLLPAAVSNWGAYGVAASMAILARDKRLLLTPAEEERLLRVAAVRGCVDGICRRGVYGIDGLPGATSVALVQELQRIAQRAMSEESE
ncbi:MAG: DUF4392 domain-containing protein [Candidatus Atribacteria bacterium]|nr:MAG: DUF4392 domain-containing protein [Candidatus Atribacteria bacterium]